MNGIAPPEWDMILKASMQNDAAGIRQLILQQGVSPSHSNAVSQSALHIASLWGNVEAVEALLEHNAAVNAQNKMTGATPLHCAVQSMKGTLERRIECMDKLIAHGADVSVADFFGKTAAEYCDDNLVLAKKLQPKPPALFSAIKEGNVDQVRQLVSLSKSATPGKNKLLNDEIFLGHTPFLFSLDLLLAEDDDEGQPSMQEQIQHRSKWVEILKVLLVEGADVNQASATVGNDNNPLQALEGPGSPPLQRVCDGLEIAYKKKNPESIKLLEDTCKLFLEYKAKVTVELEQLLHTACRKNELDFAKLLIDVVGIDPNVRGRQGMTPLQFAARSGKCDMVAYLLSLPNIDIGIQDDRGQTALDAARVNNKQDIVSLLENFASTLQ